MIPLHQPYLTGNEIKYIEEVFKQKHLRGNGSFTQKSQNKLKEILQAQHVLLTSSCTDALEMAAILINIQPGDEVIIPSYTFSSTANAFELRGAKIVFADSLPHHPNMDVSKLPDLITDKTKAIVPVHYAGEAVEMDALMSLAEKHQLYVIEDAAHSFGGHYKGKALGTIGHFGTFSFHDTKLIVTGEGGALTINDSSFLKQAEYVLEKGTNRLELTRNEVEKYNWVARGSSFLPSEVMAATLLAQLESFDKIQKKRQSLVLHYLYELKDFSKDFIKASFDSSWSHFYLICPTEEIRDNLIDELDRKGIASSFHYRCLHLSPFAQKELKNKQNLPNATAIEKKLLRLPLFVELSKDDVTYICSIIRLYPIIAAQKPF